MDPIRVFLVDDHAVLRQALRLLFDAQRDMQVVGEADGGRDAAAAVRNSRADVVILDVSMPDMSGPAAASSILAASPGVKIVALTRHAENAYVHLMLQAGAKAYVLKQTAADTLLAAVRHAYRGETYVDPAIAAETDASLSRPWANGAAPLLTPREREVLTMVAYGHTNKEIAATLDITVKTVEAHKSNIMQKLGITSKAELVRFALAEGWLQDR